tara:strand:- start:1755 stop:1958 length:204 start_codon:yes stop_codon:yes gene_type:complete
MPKHYEVKYTIHAEHTDRILNADNEQHAMEQIIADLENNTGDGYMFKEVTTFTSITEVEYISPYEVG